MKKAFSLDQSLLILFLLNSYLAFTQQSILKSTLNELASSVQADVGVMVLENGTFDTLSLNGNKHFPMQSVFKFHLALAVLKQVDEGKLSLDKKYHISKDRYFKTWSVLMKQHPEGNVDVSLEDLITWTVENSDNVACDMLFDILGGPQKVDTFIKSLGVTDIAIVSTEREMHQGWDIQFENWTTPNATAALLKRFLDGGILSARNTELLMAMMIKTPNAPKRLKGLLPEGAIVARKPGTGDTNGEVYGAINDVGIITLPNNKKIIIAAYVTRAKDFAAGELVIAKMARAVYDHYNK